MDAVPLWVAYDYPRCRFCGKEAVCRVWLSRGCACYAADPWQDLCVQHVLRATPIGEMAVVQDYSVGGGFTRWWAARA